MQSACSVTYCRVWPVQLYLFFSTFCRKQHDFLKKIIIEHKLRYNQLDAASDLLIINQFSTCFGRVYAHLQEVALPYTAYGF
jgi:hypothetical protein